MCVCVCDTYPGSPGPECIELGEGEEKNNQHLERTLADIAVLDLLQHLGPHSGVDVLVLVVVLGLELDDLSEPSARVANPGLSRGKRFGVRDVLGGGDRRGFGPECAHPVLCVWGGGEEVVVGSKQAREEECGIKGEQ